MKPTDEELEAMAERLDRGERRMDRKPADNNAAEAALRREAAALLRACKGRVKPLELAVMFHEAYESLAPEFGYETRQETRNFDPASPNGQLMIAVTTRILAALEQEPRHE